MEEFELAKLIEFNQKAEAQAVFDYTELLKQVSTVSDTEIKEKVVAVVSEIIADELNHNAELQKLYEEIVGIEAKKE